MAPVWLAVFSGYLGFGATLQVLPGWVVSHFSGGPFTTGLTVGIAFAATALFRPFAGRAGDAGRSRVTLLVAAALICLGALGQLLAPSLAILIAARLGMGAGEAALFSGALPVVLAAAPVERRGSVAGRFGLAMWSGLAVGPLLASGVSYLSGPRVVWATVIGLGGLTGVLAARLPRDSPRPDVRVRPDSWRSVLPRGAALPGLAFGLAAYGYGTISAILVLYLRTGIGGAGVGFAIFTCAFLLARLVGSPLVDRAGGSPVVAASVLVEMAGFGLLAATDQLATALLGAALCGIGVSLTFPATVALTLRRTGAAGAGAAVGAVTSFWDLGIFVAGPLAGVLADRVGYSAGFAAAAVAAGLSLGLTLLLWRRANQTVTSSSWM